MFKLLEGVRLFKDDEAMWILARRPGLLALSREEARATRRRANKVSTPARNQTQPDTKTRQRRRFIAAT